MLQLSDLHAYYGKSHVLHGVDLEVPPGESSIDGELQERGGQRDHVVERRSALLGDEVGGVLAPLDHGNEQLDAVAPSLRGDRLVDELGSTIGRSRRSASWWRSRC